jgi:hypothetical protein
MRIIEKFFQARKNMSTSSLLVFIVTAPARKLKFLLNSRAIDNVDSPKDRFTIIYHRNSWGSQESISGPGSTLAMTESIRELLPILFQKFSISSILDAPCGDFNWMRLVDLQGISYLGGEIVKPLVSELNMKFSSDGIAFIQMDITKDRFAKRDLVLNRDCLFHLSYHDIFLTLSNFLESGSKYFLSTSHDNDQVFSNSNIKSSGFRRIDLFLTPFSFPKNFHFQIPEKGEGSLPPRSLYLWEREQIKVAHSNLENFLSGL